MSGANATDPKRFLELTEQLGIDPARFSSTEIKAALRSNTEEAAARGVFGVPTFVLDGEVFWGADAIEFVKAVLEDPALLKSDEMRRVDALPVGAARKA